MIFSSAAAQTAQTPPPGGSIFDLLIPLALMFAVMYFLVIRPQNNARKRHQEMVQGVKRGDTVVTAGGLVGKVVKSSDDAEIQVELAEGMVVKVIKATLSDVRPKGGKPAESKSADAKPAKEANKKSEAANAD